MNNMKEQAFTLTVRQFNKISRAWNAQNLCKSHKDIHDTISFSHFKGESEAFISVSTRIAPRRSAEENIQSQAETLAIVKAFLAPFGLVVKVEPCSASYVSAYKQGVNQMEKWAQKEGAIAERQLHKASEVFFSRIARFSK